MSGRTALRLAACLVVAALLAFSQLGERPPFSPAETRYALVAREMVEGDDWIQPHLNGVRYYSGVSFYTGHPTRMLEGASDDLSFGYHRGDAPGRFLTREEFDRPWAASDRVFVVGDRGLEIPGAVVLAAGPRAKQMTNRPLPNR